MVADFFKTGVWGTDNTLAGGDQWSDFANSDPEADIRTASQTIQKSTGSKGNKLIIGPEVRDKLAVHPLLLEVFKYTNTGFLTDQQIMDALKFPGLIVGEAVDNTAQEGATFSGEFMWGKNALMIQVPSTAGRRIPAAGYTFVWTMGGGNLTVQITKKRDDDRDREVMRGKHAYDQKATGTDLGYFFANAVA